MLLEEILDSALALLITPRKAGRKKVLLSRTSAEAEFLSFIIPGLKTIHLACLQYQNCYDYFSPKPLLFKGGEKDEARSKVSRSMETESLLYSEHAPNKADTN